MNTTDPLQYSALCSVCAMVADSFWSYYVKFTALIFFVYFMSLVNIAAAHGKTMQCQQKKNFDLQ